MYVLFCWNKAPSIAEFFNIFQLRHTEKKSKMMKVHHQFLRRDFIVKTSNKAVQYLKF
jgi:hypothetical protein